MRLSTTLPVSAASVWAEVLRPRLFLHVAAPAMVVEPVEPDSFPAVWGVGTFRVRMRLFGLLPMGEQRIVTSAPGSGSGRRRFRDDGSGTLARRWRHEITVEALGPDRCRYTDEVLVEAGVLTPGAWAFARLFFAHRQRRLRALAASGFTYA